MSIVEELHRQHKERRLRFEKAAIAQVNKEPPAAVLRTWIPKVVPNWPRQAPSLTDEAAWRLEICGVDASEEIGRVQIEAIQNAVSIAGTAMTMGALVVEVPAEEKADAGGGMGGGMGMM